MSHNTPRIQNGLSHYTHPDTQTQLWHHHYYNQAHQAIYQPSIPVLVPSLPVDRVHVQDQGHSSNLVVSNSVESIDQNKGPSEFDKKNSKKRSRSSDRLYESLEYLSKYLQQNPDIHSITQKPSALLSALNPHPKLKEELIKCALVINTAFEQNRFEYKKYKINSRHAIQFANALKDMETFEKKELEWQEFVNSDALNLFDDFDAFTTQNTPAVTLPSSSFILPTHQPSVQHNKVQDSKPQLQARPLPTSIEHDKVPTVTRANPTLPYPSMQPQHLLIQFVKQQVLALKLINDPSYVKLDRFLRSNPKLISSINDVNAFKDSLESVLNNPFTNNELLEHARNLILMYGKLDSFVFKFAEALQNGDSMRLRRDREVKELYRFMLVLGYYNHDNQQNARIKLSKETPRYKKRLDYLLNSVNFLLLHFTQTELPHGLRSFIDDFLGFPIVSVSV